MKQNKEDKKDPWPSIVGYSFIFLVIAGTIAGFFDIGGPLAIFLGVAAITFVIWIITAMILHSVNPESKESSIAIKALLIAICIAIGLLYAGLNS